jgi:hypothetical protein
MARKLPHKPTHKNVTATTILAISNNVDPLLLPFLPAILIVLLNNNLITNNLPVNPQLSHAINSIARTIPILSLLQPTIPSTPLLTTSSAISHLYSPHLHKMEAGMGTGTGMICQSQLLYQLRLIPNNNSSQKLPLTLNVLGSV